MIVQVYFRGEPNATLDTEICRCAETHFDGRLLGAGAEIEERLRDMEFKFRDAGMGFGFAMVAHSLIDRQEGRSWVRMELKR